MGLHLAIVDVDDLKKLVSAHGQRADDARSSRGPRLHAQGGRRDVRVRGALARGLQVRHLHDDQRRDGFIAADRELTGHRWQPDVEPERREYVGRQRMLFATESDARKDCSKRGGSPSSREVIRRGLNRPRHTRRGRWRRREHQARGVTDRNANLLSHGS
ncbi:MAG: hypothetical protein QOI98_2784 [Solirubrobacteraceae bacterium]|jgi:hypothetical protein|nr:hypothetical protein [Solirubrobacteraceae bacterium]